VAVRVELSEDAFLRAPALVKRDDPFRARALVGHDDLELVSVRYEELELNWLFADAERVCG
jgi:hypothetical protein